jgi:hypothetical protein
LGTGWQAAVCWSCFPIIEKDKSKLKIGASPNCKQQTEQLQADLMVYHLHEFRRVINDCVKAILLILLALHAWG